MNVIDLLSQINGFKHRHQKVRSDYQFTGIRFSKVWFNWDYQVVDKFYSSEEIGYKLMWPFNYKALQVFCERTILVILFGDISDYNLITEIWKMPLFVDYFVMKMYILFIDWLAIVLFHRKGRDEATFPSRLWSFPEEIDNLSMWKAIILEILLNCSLFV